MKNLEDDVNIEKEDDVKTIIDDLKAIKERQKYVNIGALMILVGTILAFVFYDWKLVLILFLTIQGNEIAQGHNDNISNILDKIFNKTDNYKE